MLAALVVAFILGALFSLLVVTSVWLYTAPLVKRKEEAYMPPYTSPSLPEALRDTPSGDDAVETCKWFNHITAFLFQELHDSPDVKSFIMAKIHKEFNELMFTKKEGRMIEQLTVRDYDFGTSLPLFNHAVVQQKTYSSTEAGQLEEVCVGVHVDYSGGFCIGVDADLVFNRVAYVAIRVVKVKGHGQLRFTTLPCTHWSFAFSGDPEMTLEVESTFEGRSFPQLSSFIEAQLRRWLRQKHTLPASKTRYKPFFLKPEPQSQLNELYVHNKRLTVGKLYVEIVKCSKLLHPPSAVATFCTLSISSLPWQPLLGLWHSRWPEYEFRVHVNDLSTTLGIGYKLVVWEGKEEKRSEYVMISKVVSGSLAAKIGAQIGDIIVRVNNVRVHSVVQVKKAIKKTKRSSILIAVKRPPKDISGHMLQQVSTSTTRRTADTASGVKSDGEREEGVQRSDGDSISLHDSSQSADAITSSRLVSEAPVVPTLLPRGTKNVDKPGTTEDVDVCRGPQWKTKKFKFTVGPKQHYLNVCVYDRLSSTSPNEERRELLIGHVTVPLMDVALECLTSSSGRHHQRYVLLAPKLTRATANRAVVHASEGGRGRGRREEEDGKQFVGSILLRFQHTTFHGSSRPPAEGQERVDGEETHSTTQERETPVTRLHQFQVKELEGVQRCHICRKRIWALKGRVQVCVRCGIQCHKRCVTASHKALPCKQAISDLQSHESEGFQIYEDTGGDERDGETEEGEEEWVEHRSLRQQTSEDGFMNVPPVDEEFVKVEGGEIAAESDGEVSWKTASGQDKDRGGGSDSENVQRSNSEDEHSSSESGSDSGGEETEQRLAELIACRTFSHLPEQERAAAIQSKVVEMEAEIERAQQLVTSTETQLNCDHGNQESLKRQLRQHREKLKPLQLMREQYTLALQQSTFSHEVTETET